MLWPTAIDFFNGGNIIPWIAILGGGVLILFFAWLIKRTLSEMGNPFLRRKP